MDILGTRHRMAGMPMDAFRPEIDRASMGDGVTSSPCKTCKHFKMGTDRLFCREFPDCLLGPLRQPVFSMQRCDKPKGRPRGKYEIRYCELCGKKIIKGRRSIKDYSKSRYCSKKCYFESGRSKGIGKV